MKPAAIVIAVCILGIAGFVFLLSGENASESVPLVPEDEKLIDVLNPSGEVDLDSLLHPERWTVIEFYLEDERDVDPQGRQLWQTAKNTRKFRVRRIHIGEWDSPVCRQLRVLALPKWWLYEGKTRITSDRREILHRFTGPR